MSFVAGVRCSFRGKDAGRAQAGEPGRNRGRRIGASSAARRHKGHFAKPSKSVSRELGLRERKKLQTRRRIREAALGLFTERGFEGVTVAAVAREADVSEATVFNYFPTKEDLFYERMEAFEAELLEAIRSRAPGESVLAAFARFVLLPRGLLAEPEAGEALASLARIVTESPALLARERQIFDRYTDALAALLAEETGAGGDDVAPWVAANALIGLHRALVGYVRRQALAGRRNPDLLRDFREEAERAVAVLERGLGDYAVKPS